MKKFLAILTVMTMVLTTLVVPTVAFAESGSSGSTVTANGKVIIKDEDGNVKKEITLGAMNEPRPYGFPCDVGDYVTMQIELIDGDGNQIISEVIDTITWVEGDDLSAPPIEEDALACDIGKVTDEKIGVRYKCIVNFKDSAWVECVFELGSGGQNNGGGFECFDESYNYDNEIIVNYIFCNEEGKEEWVPKAIELEEDMTFEAALNEANIIAPTNHFAELTDSDIEVCWNIVGTTYGWANSEDIPYAEPATGGEISFSADYGAKKIINAKVVYYDVAGKKQTIEVPVVPTENDVDGEDVYDKVMSKVSAQTIQHKNGFIDNSWTVMGCDLADPIENIDYLTIVAQYSSYDVDLIYTYLENNEIKTQSKTVQLDDLDAPGATIEKTFLDNIPEGLKNDTNITGWVFDQQCIPSYLMGPPDDVLNGPIDPTNLEIKGAALYTDKSPVEISYYPIKYDVDAEEYYTPQNTSELIYVESAIPDISDQESENPDGTDAESEQFWQNVVQAAESYYVNKYGQKVKDYTFIGFNDAGGQINDGFIPTSMLDIEYDNILVILELPGGSKEYATISNNENKIPEYQLPATHNVDDDTEVEVPLWTLEVANIGGTARPGGKTIKLNFLSPYILFTAYDVVINDLPADKESVKPEMKEKALGAARWKDKDHVKIHYHDVKLVKKDVNGQQVEVSHEDFPEGGQVIYMPYPEGTDKNTTFVITHRIESGPNAGKVEVLESKNCDQGIRIMPRSLSPIAIAYGDIVPSEPGNGTTPGTSGGPGTAAPTPDKAVDTGDDFSAIPYIAVMAIALAGVAVALFRRKTVK